MVSICLQYYQRSIYVYSLFSVILKLIITLTVHFKKNNVCSSRHFWSCYKVVFGHLYSFKLTVLFVTFKLNCKLQFNCIVFQFKTTKLYLWLINNNQLLMLVLILYCPKYQAERCRAICLTTISWFKRFHHCNIKTILTIILCYK